MSYPLAITKPAPSQHSAISTPFVAYITALQIDKTYACVPEHTTIARESDTDRIESFQALPPKQKIEDIGVRVVSSYPKKMNPGRISMRPHTTASHLRDSLRSVKSLSASFSTRSFRPTTTAYTVAPADKAAPSTTSHPSKVEHASWR